MPRLSELMGGDKRSTVKLSDLVRGQSRPSFRAADLPDLDSDEFKQASGFGFLDFFKPAMSSMFGSDRDVANAIAKKIPGAEYEEDDEGYAVLRLPDGQRFALDKPGIQNTEVAALLGRVGSAVPAGRMVGKLATLPGRIAAGGAAGVAVDAAQQKLAGREEIDPKQSAIAGAFGAGGEALAPVFGWAASRVRDWFRTDAGRVKFGHEVARKLGQEVDDATALKIGQQAMAIRSGGVSPQQAADSAEFGYRLTPGQRSGDFRQLAREERLAQDGGIAGDIMRRQESFNSAQVGQNVDDMLSGMTRNRAPGSMAEATEAVTAGLQRQHRAARAGVRQAYDSLDGSGASVAPDFARELPGRVRAAIQDVDIHPTVTPSGVRALAQIEDLMTGKATFEQVRKRINSLMPKGSANPTDKMAVTRIKGALDQWLDDAIEQSMVTGDVAAIDALKKARGLHAEMMRRFAPNAPGDTAGKLVQKLVNSGASPEELAKTLYGASQVSKGATASVAERIKAALGDNVEAWDQFRSAVLLQATTKQTGERLGPQAIVSNLKTLLKERPTLVSSIYSPSEVSRMTRFVNATEAILKKGDFARSSGTAERMYRYIQDVAGPIPFLGGILRGLGGPGRVAAAYRYTSGPAAARSSLPFAAGASSAGAQTNDQRRRGRQGGRR